MKYVSSLSVRYSSPKGNGGDKILNMLPFHSVKLVNVRAQFYGT